MKFTVDRDALFLELQKIQSVVERRSTVPILANILVSVNGNELSLCGTDLEVGVLVTLPITSGESGRITISAKNFLDIVRELPSKPVTISRKSNDWVDIGSGKSKFNIVGLPAEDFPTLPSFDDKSFYQARYDALAEMIDKTAFAVSTDAARYHLNGVFFEQIEGSVMRMTGTDGHRLSYIDQEVFLQAPEFRRGVIIQKKGLLELRKLLEQKPSNFTVAVEKTHFFAIVGNTRLFIKLIDGEFPDYRMVIPKQMDRSCKMDTESFHSALRRVSLLAHEKSKGVKIGFDKNLMVISSSNPDMGEAREEVDVEYGGDAIEVGFNAKYLLDCMAVANSKTMEFLFKDRLSPGILRGSENKNHTYVIMPMRI